MTRQSAHCRGYNRRWRKLRAEAIAAHPWCVDCLTTGTPDNPLQGDHEIPLAAGGLTAPGNVSVRCRSCNARKGSRPAARTQLTLDGIRVAP